MNKRLFKIIVLRSVVPLFWIIMVLVRPQVPKIATMFAVAALVPIYLALAERNSEKVDRSVSIKGLAHAAIAVPFLMLFAGAAFFAVSYCFVFIDKHFDEITQTIILLMIITTFWSCDIYIALSKEKKKTLPIAASDTAPPN